MTARAAASTGKTTKKGSAGRLLGGGVEVDDRILRRSPVAPATFSVGTVMVFRDESLKRLFEKQGFVTVPLLSPDEVAAVRERFFDIHDRRDADSDSLSLKQGYYVSLDHRDGNYRRQAEALVRETLAPRAAASLCGYRFLLGSFLLKPAGAGSLAVHRDWTMTADPRQTSLNCWCPLVDVDGENGALALLPGSHRCLPDNVHGPGMTQYLQLDRQRLPRLLRIVPLKAGEAAIFDYRMLHGSTANTTFEARPAIGGGFVPETARPMLHVRDAADGKGLFRMLEPEAEGWTDVLTGLMEPGRPDLRVVGRVRDRNRSMGQAEFERRLAGPVSGPTLAALRLRDKAGRVVARTVRMGGRRGKTPSPAG
jgi:hypothetical protein